MEDIEKYAKQRFEEIIDDNDIATEIKKAIFGYCARIAPPDFAKYHEKLGYCYIFVRNMVELLYKNNFPVPVFSIEPDELDVGIDEELVDAMCEDIDDFCISWADDDNSNSNAKAIPLLKKAFPDAPLITNIMGIAAGIDDDNDGDDEDSSDQSLTEEEKNTLKEIEKIDNEIRENQIKQAAIMQAYIKEIKKQNFPINAKELVLTFFKEAGRDADKAWEILTSTPAYFSPIDTEKLKKSGIKDEDIPNEAKKANKRIAEFLKKLQV